MSEDEVQAAAEQHLLSQGYRVVARDYRTAWGRLDFVCRDGPVLAFVQVRDPRNAKPGEAEREALARTAADFLGNRGWWHFVCRFDAVVVSPDGWVELVRDSW
ncbi:MAG: YraN family protein [Bacillota bacterium]